MHFNKSFIVLSEISVRQQWHGETWDGDMVMKMPTTLEYPKFPISCKPAEAFYFLEKNTSLAFADELREVEA